MDVADLLRENGIRVPSTVPGRYSTTCPRCSAQRKGTHKNMKVLGITIKPDGGAHWGCNHCGWTGPEKGSGKINGHDHTDRNIYYDYVDEAGNLLFQKVREPNKNFWQRKPDGRGGWVTKLGDTRKVIYRLPEVNEAIASGYTIYVVEGEKDADNLWRINVPATCNPDGASEPNKKPKWRSEYSEMLHDADLVVIPDNDPAGRAHADAVVEMSAGIAASVRILDIARHWPACPKGGDISDWLAAGHTREQFDALVAETPAKNDAPNPFTPTALDDIQVDDDPVWLIDRMLPAGPAFHLVWGKPKSFKSFGLMHAYLHIAASQKYAGREVLPGAVVYVTSEGVRGVKRRLVAMRQQLGITGRGVPFYLVTVMPNLGTGAHDAMKLIAAIKAAVPARAALRAIAIDTVRRATPGKDENSAKDMSPLIENCGFIASEFQCLVSGVHHAPRSSDEHGAGTNALDGAADCGWSVERNGDRATVRLAVMKDGEQGESWDFSLCPDQVGINRAGEPIMGCGVQIDRLPGSEPAQKAALKARGPKSAPIALRALQEAIDELGAKPPASNHIPPTVKKTVTIAQWRQYAYARGISDGEARAQQKAFREASQHLIAAQQAGVWEQQVWLPTA